MPSTAIQQLPEHCLLAGRYRILEKLGEGGMGAVYKAHDERLDRDVAVKVLPPHSLHDADALARFQRESRALAKLSHPNIIQAYDNGDDNGRHFLVMEYVEGFSLAAILQQQGAVAPTMAADMIYQAAVGLQHAHEKGLVHRDLKPANLLLSPVQSLSGRVTPAAADSPPPDSQVTTNFGPLLPGKGILKILDLGLARFLHDQLGDSQVTQEGAGVGTPDYMAPEQFRDALHADARTDIYGLGCTLYHLVGGSVPFPGSSFSEKAAAHAKREPIPLEERCPEVPVGLALVVSKMMAKHPADRFQSAAEVAEALGPYVAGASHSMILVRQTMRFGPGQLTVREPKPRQRALLWGGRAIVAGVMAGLLMLAWPTIFPRQAGEPKDNSQVESPGPREPAPDPVEPAKPAKPQVVTIENGLTVAKDGTGQYRTIGEALENVKPEQTIRVLDDGVYREALNLRNRHAQEGLTLESPRRASLEFPPEAKLGLVIYNVPRVTVRGFSIRTQASGTVCIGVGGLSPSTLLADLACSSNHVINTTGVTLDGIGLAPGEEPVRVLNCTFAGLNNGIELIGLNLATQQGVPLRRVVVEGSSFNACSFGIRGAGTLNDVHLVGNRFWNCSVASIRLSNLQEGAGRILVANNSIKGLRSCLEFAEVVPRMGSIEFVNNIVIAESGPDLVGLEENPSLSTTLVLAKNWRQVERPIKDSPEATDWIDSALDKFVEKLPLASLDPSRADFLRPEKNSPLATAGAGGDLPAYVGAIPPDGVEPWDWAKTWNARGAKNREQGKGTGTD